MITISLCMIVKNEEKVLSKCLDSIKDIAEEIIIVDTGSTDNTKKIASFYTDKIFDFKWIDDFSAARNFSFSKASKEYILWLDADDIILKEDRKEFFQLKENLSDDTDVVMMRYNVGFDESGNANESYFRERLVKRSCNFKWADRIHEYIGVSGKIVNSDVCITHVKNRSNNVRNLKIFKKMRSSSRSFSPRNLYYYAKELYFNKQYNHAILYYKRFLQTSEGWIEDYINACSEIAQCYRAKNNRENELMYLMKSFSYDVPRAETCCELGYFFKNANEYDKAIFWFETALSLKKSENTWGTIKHDCYGYIPSIELCVCYYKLGNKEEAIKYNKLAEQFKPSDKMVEYNKKFFGDL
ncbi:glycosyltransferase family 2 protein [Clostridiaceae bacterium UIB06]|uniref:Glycosyltransferase family 2 protein n=1 Tax=Clostridium thailandense TaxID=2794346 RepID=A0A949WXI8_9CLOT|nr:glycosyltransferase family 2 protein [Clostridium thailandense]MBV7276007.1 glycosyltransferase family 2 protein [Clostridium thailandense]MCH5138093.1 glycosyltransferase family 2 protein [Clostridiaceae bacterium UIB06]